MDRIDFPQWVDVGSYGGLVCSLLVAIGLALYVLRRRRGTPRQMAQAIIACFAASILTLPAVWWDQNRLDVYGPALSYPEVIFWLVWIALLGWGVPLGVLAAFATVAVPQQPTPVRRGFDERASAVAVEKALADPNRRSEPLGRGNPWAQLIPVETEAPMPAIPLTRQVTVLGREVDNDIMLDDLHASRHHAEIRWDHGRVLLQDLVSMNGTFVNSQAVEGLAALRAGDVVRIGDHRFRFEPLTDIALNGHSAAIEETRKIVAHRQPTTNGSAQHEIPSLAALNGQAAGSEWIIGTQLTVIGRKPDCEISLPDDSVSRTHAQIVHQPEGYFLTDLGSSNGTFLNDTPLHGPTHLSPGDLIYVGEVLLRFEMVPTPSQKTMAPRPQVPQQNGHQPRPLRITSPFRRRKPHDTPTQQR